MVMVVMSWNLKYRLRSGLVVLNLNTKMEYREKKREQKQKTKYTINILWTKVK